MIYEYKCSECDHEWELEQKMSEDAITECPSCHNENSASRIITGGLGFHLKGSGWFKSGGY